LSISFASARPEPSLGGFSRSHISDNFVYVMPYSYNFVTYDSEGEIFASIATPCFVEKTSRASPMAHSLPWAKEIAKGETS